MEFKVSNNSQYIVNSVNRNNAITPVKTNKDTDSFKKQEFVSAPNTANTTLNSLYNSFSPILLLNILLEKEQIEYMMAKNPRVNEILKENGIEAQINTNNVRNIRKSHITTTNSYALQIANQMNVSAADKKVLEKACIFHDFGKILIPDEILNKHGLLNEEERKIMDLHAELGYELLSTTGLDKRALELVRNHHKPSNEQADLLNQILSVADVYSALREVRSYKASLSEKEALQILDLKASKGELSTEVVKALKDSLLACVA